LWKRRTKKSKSSSSSSTTDQPQKEGHGVINQSSKGSENTQQPKVSVSFPWEVGGRSHNTNNTPTTTTTTTTAVQLQTQQEAFLTSMTFASTSLRRPACPCCQ
jgi:hypothetical protein